jgi:hypothetical protein
MNQVDLKRKLDQILAATVDEDYEDDDDSTIQTALKELVELFDQTEDHDQQAEINQKIKEVFFDIESSIAEAEEEDLEATIQMWKQVCTDLSLSKHDIDLNDVDNISKAVKFNPAEAIKKAVEEAVEAAIVESQKILDALKYEGSTRDRFTDDFSDMPALAAEAIHEKVSNYKHCDFLADVVVPGLSDGYIARKRLRLAPSSP